MPKSGILHDYDLMANNEKSAPGNTCVVCGWEDMYFQWSDYSGEAMCSTCGCPYQLKWGSDKQVQEAKYPYLNLKDNVLIAAKEYWNDKKAFVCYGMMMGPQPGMKEFISWCKEHHPEILKD
jgi:hypothetical protein